MRQLLALFSLALAASTAAAQAPPSSLPPVRAVRANAPILIDGRLDEAAWQTAPPVGNFKQRDPNEGAPASQRTEARIIFDDDAIYVAARMHEAAPDSIIARLARRDDEVPADFFAVYLDPFFDRRSGYYFAVNAAGVLYDGTVSNDGFEDNSWDGVWQGRAHVDENGWTCEIRVPFSQMRYAGGAAPVWGVNFVRKIQRLNETDYVVYTPKNSSGFVSRFPELQGLENLRRSNSIEITPYVTSKAKYLQHDANDPFNDGSSFSGDAGGDLRMSVGSKLKLNATVNPDFGQVEVDPAVVNLSDVESFFQEKRPFFVEGIQNFRFGNEGSNSYWNFNWPEPMFFYSRRIGRAPQGSTPDTTFADVPLGTSILGAAKLTGKLGERWNFGTLHALTASEQAKIAFGPERWKQEVEPLTYYGIARGLREFKDRRFGFGVLGDAVVRDFDGPALEDALNSRAYVGGVDGWAFLDPKKVWVVSGWTAMSRVEGSTARLTDLQTSSRHYFQRPDAGHVEVDPNATSMTGWGSRYWLNKQEGRVIFNAGLGAISPEFEVNDLGFQSRTDVVNGHVATGYKWNKPTKTYKNNAVYGALFGSKNFAGDNTWLGAFLGGDTEFANNFSLSYSSAYNPRTKSDRRTRGGPQTENAPGYEVNVYLDTDGKRSRFYYVSYYGYTQPEADSWNWNVNPGVEFKPVSNLSLNIGPSYEHVHEDAQYLRTVEDPLASATYGSRYVFGVLDQKTFAASVRFNWAFTPALSVQMFAQPLVSSGSYTDFKELARPGGYDFTHYASSGGTYDRDAGVLDPDGAGPAPAYGLDNPDFNYKSLRGNAVLRWEYGPGSTLFLVWTQTREDSETLGDFRFRKSLSRLVDQKPDNIFLAKVTYYFTP